jgi:hypothetical protein
MIIAIHQPEFMPWLGFFDKMMRVENYVVFDHVQFKKRYFENRNRIKFNDQPMWLSVPVKSKGKYLQPINEVETDNSTDWQKKLWESIRHVYSKSPCFGQYGPELKTIIFAGPYLRLIDFNLAIINWLRSVLRIDTPFFFSSQLEVDDFKASDLIREICHRMKADRYLCGPSGKDYLHIDDFKRAGIEIVWQEYEHPAYPQPGNDFIPYMSTIDLVFNCGPASRDIILSGSGSGAFRQA